MTMRDDVENRFPGGAEGLGLAGLMVLQGGCAAFFLGDVVSDFSYIGHQVLFEWHLVLELLASITLVLAIALEGRMLMRLIRRQAHFRRGLSVASGALHDLIEAYFDSWALTAAERDVATFAIKGLSNAEIAQMRGSAEGTVKAHLNAIYRKAGVQGRGALLSMLVEDLMQEPLITPQA